METPEQYELLKYTDVVLVSLPLTYCSGILIVGVEQIPAGFWQNNLAVW